MLVFLLVYTGIGSTEPSIHAAYSLVFDPRQSPNHRLKQSCNVPEPACFLGMRGFFVSVGLAYVPLHAATRLGFGGNNVLRNYRG